MSQIEAVAAESSLVAPTRSLHAQRWSAELIDRACIVDVRGDVLRIGLGLYHDEDDMDAFAILAGEPRG